MTQNLQKMTKLARADLSIPPLCLGMTALADMPDTYGYGVDEARAMRTLEAVFNGPIAFIDTSRNYGLGRSEERIGKAIRNIHEEASVTSLFV